MEYELYHHGVKGMKWGVRKARNHAGTGRYVTKKRQLAGDKRDLERLKNGKHLSVGLTKKRQAAFDARDKAALEKRIAKNEAKNTDGTQRKGLSDKQKKALKIGAAVAGTVLAVYAAKKVSDVVSSNQARKGAEAADRALQALQKSEAWKTAEYTKMLRDAMANSTHGQLNMFGYSNSW